MTAQERAERARRADDLCKRAFDAAGCPDVAVALVAVGGYGRAELAPYSDLDIVLVHDDDLVVDDWAARLWYPLWDSGWDIDHAVRSIGDVLSQAREDLRVGLGMLDLRHLAGDPSLTLRLRTAMFTAWRRDVRERLPELRRLVAGREELLGELADAAVPNLKESIGGLRDATVLRGLVASWLVDVPHADVERCRRGLLDVRDVLQRVAGRRTDRVIPEYWPDIAAELGLPDATGAQRRTRAHARQLTHISRLTWRRVDAVLRKPRAAGVRRPRLDPIAPGIAVSHEEVVLDRGVRPHEDPLLLLRAAAEAAERDLVLAPTTAARLRRDGTALPTPWPPAARDLLVRLLAAGRGLLPVWETLDETGALSRLLPEWDRVRLLPHASTIHRFTVDRHLVETCIAASSLIRRVARPDVLMVAALLHDVGKGTEEEHCAAGAPMARAIATRMGFEVPVVGLIGDLVRWHLLLPKTATTRDLQDPATVDHILAHVADQEMLGLLAALAEADARATADTAWSGWRAGLVADLVQRTASALGRPPAPTPVGDRVVVHAHLAGRPGGGVQVEIRSDSDGSVVQVIAPDRPGLLADVAATLALQRAPVRAARAWPQHADGIEYGASQWWVDKSGLDAAVLRNRLEGIRAGRIDATARLTRPGADRLTPSVQVRPGASARSTVLEVRAGNRPGLIYMVCAALARCAISVRSAHIATLGPQAVDVFYVQEAAGGLLDEERARSVADVVRAALGGDSDALGIPDPRVHERLPTLQHLDGARVDPA